MKRERPRRKKSLEQLKGTIVLVLNYTKRVLLLALKELKEAQIPVQKIMKPWRSVYSWMTTGKGSSKELGNALVKKSRWSLGYFKRRSSVQYPASSHFYISHKSLRNKTKTFRLILSESRKVQEIILSYLSCITSLISTWSLLWKAC